MAGSRRKLILLSFQCVFIGQWKQQSPQSSRKKFQMQNSVIIKQINKHKRNRKIKTPMHVKCLTKKNYFQSKKAECVPGYFNFFFSIRSSDVYMCIYFHDTKNNSKSRNTCTDPTYPMFIHLSFMIVSRLALFAGFRTRNFFRRFSQSVLM